jgi:hypothetical protein
MIRRMSWTHNRLPFIHSLHPKRLQQQHHTQNILDKHDRHNNVITSNFFVANKSSLAFW